MTAPRFRTAAGQSDAEGIAQLHADSWRRHYRGAYSDAYLAGDVLSDRRAVWSARLAADADTLTVVAEGTGGIDGFVHVDFDDDETWGSLVDNLHVSNELRRSGIGTVLMAQAATAVAARGAARPMYLWVLEQNLSAQRFYESLGGSCVQKTKVGPPGGVPERLNGTPYKLRMAWPDAALAVPPEPAPAG
jgi:ribosomal protein S18 acetylase RimI-like enzyme